MAFPNGSVEVVPQLVLETGLCNAQSEKLP